jgi:hypothetical protein
MTLDVIAQAPPGAAALGPLARREAGRILRHPAYVLLLVYFCILAGAEAANAGLPARETARDYLAVLALLWFGPATFFAANLVASSGRRAHAESQLEAAPTTAQTRTLATCLGVLGPTAIGVGLAAVLWIVDHVGGTLYRAQGPAELAAIPLCALGGGLLGVAVARWLAWSGAPLLVMVALIAWVVAVMERGDLRWTGPWTLSPGYLDDYGLTAGSQGWHAVYLLGLGLLAAVAALLRYPSYRRPLLALGAVLWIGTLAACWAQLR